MRRQLNYVRSDFFLVRLGNICSFRNIYKGRVSGFQNVQTWPRSADHVMILSELLVSQWFPLHEINRSHNSACQEEALASTQYHFITSVNKATAGSSSL